MRVLIGVDTSEACAPAVHMVLALGFPDLEVDLVHVIESLLPDASFPNLQEGHPLSLAYRQMEEDAKETLHAAAEPFREAGISVRTFIERGDVARNLIEHADREDCRLIACRSSSKGYYGSLFFGSVAKGLVIGARQSILVVKGEELPSAPLRAVFAHDHSTYANRCVDLLASWSPTGIAKLVVMTASDAARRSAFLLEEAPDLMAEAPLWIKEKIDERNQAVCGKLANLRSECQTEVVDGHPNTMIRQSMARHQADLLIMGAQGHGFFERLAMGSKSFYQVISEPYSVLVLRA